MGIRKRSIQANYLKVNDMFELLGTGFTELNESPSAQTANKRYINQVSATQSITGYEWSTSFNTDQIASDKAIGYIRNIGEMLLTGADTETEYIIVDLDKKASEENKFRARKFKVAIAVDIGVAHYQINSRDASDQFIILPENISSEQYGIGFKEGNTQLRDQVQATLDEMFADGTVDKIAEKYSDYDIKDSLIR